MNEDERLKEAMEKIIPPARTPIDLDRVSVNDGPYFQPKSITSKLDIVFRGEPQREVVEFCISEGWIQKYQKDWRGRPVAEAGNYKLGPKLKGTVEVYYKV